MKKGCENPAIVRQTEVQISALSLIGCMILEKLVLVDLSSHLCKMIIIVHFRGLLRALDNMIKEKNYKNNRSVKSKFGYIVNRAILK